MKKWLVLFVVSLYLLIPLSSLHPALEWIAIILSLVSGCFNIANAVKMQHNPNSETEISMKTIMILKLCLLPVYAACFMTLIVFGLLALSIWFTIPALFAIPFIIAYSYFVLFVSSSLSISRIIILGRNGTLSIWQCAIHIILQLFFMADVVDSIIVSRKERRAT